MKKVLIITITCMLNQTIFSQVSEQESTLDLLSSPNSPASSFLEISDEQIQRPTDPSSLMVSLKNVTSNFTALPTNYALDIAPAWVLGGHNISYEDFYSNQVKHSIWQNLVFSTAIKTNSNDVDTGATQIAFGIKVSILRGHVGSEFETSVNQIYERLEKLSTNYSDALDSITSNDSIINQVYMVELERYSDDPSSVLYLGFQKKIDDRKIFLIEQFKNSNGTLFMETQKNLENEIKNIADSLDFKRYGFKLDLAGGFADEFPNNNYSAAKLIKSGVWLTTGFESENGVSFLAIGRYLFNPNQLLVDTNEMSLQSNVSSFDSGLKLLYEKPNTNFSISCEAIYRSVINNVSYPSSWRQSLNINYSVKKNTVISFSLGKDFDNSISYDGNLIASLNLFAGFGNLRNL